MVECLALFLIIVFICLLTYYMNDGDLLSPACLASFAFLVCAGAAIYDCWAWNTKIEPITTLIVSCGLVSFVGPASLAYR